MQILLLLRRCLYDLGYQGHPTTRNNFTVRLYDKIQNWKGITLGILRVLFEILRFLFVYVVFNKMFPFSMRRSEKLPLEAAANKRKLFTWTKVVHRAVQTPVILAPAPAVKVRRGPAPARIF
jgi:hypothetical protein